ncbi:MAG: peptidylprolyl isomerase [Burkholderiaceae bacterium]
MLEFIRGHRRILQFVLLLFIVPSFVVVGAWDLISPGAGKLTLATVDGQRIERSDWERAHRATLDGLVAQLGRQVSVGALDTPAARTASLDRLIVDRMMAVAASQRGMAPSDETIKSVIAGIPEFQKQGRFDLETAKAFLAQRGLTTDQFEANLRSDLATEMLPRALSDSAIASRSLARRLAQLDTESRQIRLQIFSAADYRKGLTPQTGDLERFYQENQALYQTPERIDLELVVLSSPTSAEQIERFTNLVYEQSDTFESVAKELKLQVTQVKGLSRDGRTSQAGLPAAVLAVLQEATFRSKVFSAETIADRRNTEALELPNRRYVSARVLAHAPGQLLPMASVMDRLKADWLQAEGSKKAVAAAQAWLSAQTDKLKTAAATADLAGLPLEGRLVALARSNLAQASSQLGLRQPADVSALAQKIFSSQLRLRSGDVVTLPADASVAAFVLVGQRLDSAQAPLVNQRLGQAYEFVQNYEREQATTRWLRDLEPRLKVKRYADKLAAAAS